MAQEFVFRVELPVIMASMIILILTTILASALGTLYLYFKIKFNFWKKLGFAYERPEIPWGNAQGLTTRRNIGQVINDVYKNHPDKPFVGMYLFHKPALLIRDPALVKTIFVQDFMNFHDRGIYVNEKNDPLSGHLFAIGGSKWRKLRKTMTPTFSSGKMKMMFPILVECSRKLTNILDGPAEREEVVEIKDFTARFTTDIISLAAFGIDADSIHNPVAEFRRYGQLIFEQTPLDAAKQLTQYFIPWLGRLLGLTANKKEVSEFFLRVFKESMEYREENKIRRNDFMDLLIQLKQKGKIDGVDVDSGDTKFTFEEAAAQAFVFFLGGFETSSTTMMFALYELAKNPGIQDKLRASLLETLDKHNGEVTYECISEMEYLGRVIEETLRMYPPLPFLQRECNSDYKIPDTNLVIPKKVGILIDTMGFHHDAKFFADPEQFDPDRFTEAEKSKRNNYTYLPFGEGPRNCIAYRFGLMQTRVGMVSLLTNFEFSVAENTPIPIVMDASSIITSPKGGMNIKLKKLRL